MAGGTCCALQQLLDKAIFGTAVEVKVNRHGMLSISLNRSCITSLAHALEQHACNGSRRENWPKHASSCNGQTDNACNTNSVICLSLLLLMLTLLEHMQSICTLAELQCQERYVMSSK